LSIACNRAIPKSDSSPISSSERFIRVFLSTVPQKISRATLRPPLVTACRGCEIPYRNPTAISMDHSFR
jgi:hypothetical protein